MIMDENSITGFVLIAKHMEDMASSLYVCFSNSLQSFIFFTARAYCSSVRLTALHSCEEILHNDCVYLLEQLFKLYTKYFHAKIKEL